MAQNVTCFIVVKFLRNFKFKKESGKVAFFRHYFSILLSVTLTVALQRVRCAMTYFLKYLEYANGPQPNSSGFKFQSSGLRPSNNLYPISIASNQDFYQISNI